MANIFKLRIGPETQQSLSTSPDLYPILGHEALKAVGAKYKSEIKKISPNDRSVVIVPPIAEVDLIDFQADLEALVKGINESVDTVEFEITRIKETDVEAPPPESRVGSLEKHIQSRPHRYYEIPDPLADEESDTLEEAS